MCLVIWAVNSNVCKYSLFSFVGQLYICKTAPPRYFYHILKKRQLQCLLFNEDMRCLIDKALKHFYMLYESIVSCKHRHKLLSLIFKEKRNANRFTINIS